MSWWKGTPGEPSPFPTGDINRPVRKCGRPAIVRYHWPNHQPLHVCEEHLVELRAWARDLGFELLIEPPTVDGATCKQLVRRVYG